MGMSREEAIKRVKGYLVDLIKALEQEPSGDNVVSRDVVKEQMIMYGFHAPDMTVTEFVEDLPPVILQEPRWIPVSEKLPNKNQWVLVTTEDYQKIAEVMCYQGIRIGRHNVGNGWEEYEYPSWTSGHGDIQSSHPKAWMPLPAPFEPQESEG